MNFLYDAILKMTWLSAGIVGNLIGDPMYADIFGTHPIAEVVKVKDMEEIAQHGIMRMPGLVFDKKVGSYEKSLMFKKSWLFSKNLNK